MENFISVVIAVWNLKLGFIHWKVKKVFFVNYFNKDN